MTASHAIFRADASVAQGLGHFTRCRAIATEWMARGGRATFLTTETPGGLLDYLQKDGIDVRIGPSGNAIREDLGWVLSIVREEQPEVLVLDRYDVDRDYQQALKPWVRCLVCLDDVPARRFDCQILLNQNLGVSAQDYDALIAPGTRVLVGPKYALLRRDMTRHAGTYRVSKRPHRVLVTLGGSDRQDCITRVLADLASLADLELDVVLGSLYPYPDPTGRVTGLDPGRIRVHKGPDSLLDLARQADLAVTAGGSTVWELACLGIPMVVIGTAANQEAVLRGLKAGKAAHVLGWIESMERGMIGQAVQSLLAAPSRLQELSKAAIRLVDDKGVERVVEVIEEICSRLGPRMGVLAGPEKA